MRMIGVRPALAAVAVATIVVAGAGPAVAGGSRLASVRDRYEAGDVATLVGYTGGPQLEAHRAPGPYRAFLESEDGTVRMEVGQLELTDRGRRGWESLRVAITFQIPPDVRPGHYFVSYCLDPCESPAQLGDLIGGFLAVGVDPPWRQSREWPLDEPEIQNLADDALLTGPGYQATPAEVRAGRLPVPAFPDVGPAPRTRAAVPSTGPSERPDQGTNTDPGRTPVPASPMTDPAGPIFAPTPTTDAGERPSEGADPSLWMGVASTAVLGVLGVLGVRLRRRIGRASTAPAVGPFGDDASAYDDDLVGTIGTARR